MPDRRQFPRRSAHLALAACFCGLVSFAAAQEPPIRLPAPRPTPLPAVQLATRLPKRLPRVPPASRETSDQPLPRLPAPPIRPLGPTESIAPVQPVAPIEWWNERAAGAVWSADASVPLALDALLADALRHSPRIRGVALETEVAMAEVVVADAAFDSSLLMGARVGRTNDPVGNTLTTGGPLRAQESSLSHQVGVRKLTRSGGQWNVKQQLGLLDSNSVFFSPANQGNARLSISLSQPLLAGAGRLYNERLLLQAEIDGDVAWQQMQQQVQEQIAQVMISYWRLYELRCRLLQQTDLLQRGVRIEQIVAGRGDLDTGRAELLRAREQVARRRDRLIRYEADLRNEQTRLVRLVGSPELAAAGQLELIPQGQPRDVLAPVDLQGALATGLQNRPDIQVAAAQLEDARLQVQVSRNQLLPQLDALLETYVAGLNGNRDAFGSLADQFTDGAPGVAAGFQMEMPIGRRAAHAKHRAARAQMHREVEGMREKMLEARAEIETAVREVSVSIAETEMRYRTVTAARGEEEYLSRRWEMLAGDGGPVGLVLQDLLDSQQRRTDAEEMLVTARVGYLVALIHLQTAMGTLLSSERIEPVSGEASTGIHYLREESRAGQDERTPVAQRDAMGDQ